MRTGGCDYVRRYLDGHSVVCGYSRCHECSFLPEERREALRESEGANAEERFDRWTLTRAAARLRKKKKARQL